MKMFVGNATRQNITFLYRIPEHNGVRSQEIPIGAQVMLSGDLNKIQIDSIIAQHAKYGLIDVAEIDRAKEFSGYCYSIDKPISVAKISTLMDHNVSELVALGKRIRQEAAISGNNALESNLDESGRPELLRNFEMSIVEENPDERSGTEPVAEGFRVQRPEGATPPPRTRRRAA